MPKTKGESIFFTAITAWMMVYAMTIYNIVINKGVFTNGTFIEALRDMWGEYIIIFLCAYFIASHIAKFFAFRVIQLGDREICIILMIQVFTVVIQVALASILGTFKGYGCTIQFIPNYIVTYCRNFLFALPLQLILVGPLARVIFRSIFRNKER